MTADLCNTGESLLMHLICLHGENWDWRIKRRIRGCCKTTAQIRWNLPNSFSLVNTGVSSSSEFDSLALARVLREYPYQIQWGQDTTWPRDVGMCIVILIASADYFACLSTLMIVGHLSVKWRTSIANLHPWLDPIRGGDLWVWVVSVFIPWDMSTTSHRNDPQRLTEPLRCKSLAPSRACALVPRKQICLFCSPWSRFMLFPLPKLSWLISRIGIPLGYIGIS